MWERERRRREKTDKRSNFPDNILLRYDAPNYLFFLGRGKGPSYLPRKSSSPHAASTSAVLGGCILCHKRAGAKCKAKARKRMTGAQGLQSRQQIHHGCGLPLRRLADFNLDRLACSGLLFPQSEASDRSSENAPSTCRQRLQRPSQCHAVKLIMQKFSIRYPIAMAIVPPDLSGLLLELMAM